MKRKNILLGVLGAVILVGLVVVFTRTDFLGGKLIKTVKVKINTALQTLESRCMQIKAWENGGTLTRMLGGNLEEYITCKDRYPDIMFGRNTLRYCMVLAEWNRTNDLTANVRRMRGASYDPSWCAMNYPQNWYGFPSAMACATYGSWFNRGQLTGNLARLGMSTSTDWIIRFCDEDYPAAFWGERSSAFCQALGNWVRTGTLSSHLYTTDQLYWCRNSRPISFYGGLNREACTEMRRWLDAGVLTANMALDIGPGESGLPTNCATTYPDIWYGMRVGPGPPAPAARK